MTQRLLLVLLLFCAFQLRASDTLLKLYRPYGEVTNQIAPVVKKSLFGFCLAQSRVIVREDAWRCEAEGVVYDPCFVKAGDNRKEALCPQSPWVGDSVQILVGTSLHNEQNQTLDMSQTYPWGIELSNGERCLAINSTEQYDQMPVRYRCSEERFLLGHLQRCKTVWTILEKTAQGIVTAEVVKAWF